MAVVAATQQAGHDGAEISAARACPARVGCAGRHQSACGRDHRRGMRPLHGLTAAVDCTIKALLTKS